MGIMSFLASRKGIPVSQAGASPIARTKGMAEESASMGMRAATMDTSAHLASDEKEWVRYLGQAIRTYRKPGLSMKDEHQLWLAARTRNRAMATGVRNN
jgi:hypothetical protein